MAYMFNIAKGRAVELYNFVVTNTPANSALIVIPLATTGLQAQSVLEDMDDFAAVVAGATNEVTGTGWNRKTLTDSDLAALPAPDDTNNRRALALPAMTWTPSLGADSASLLVICYDGDTTSGTDANLTPIAAVDFVVVPDGNLVTYATGDFFRAS